MPAAERPSPSLLVDIQHLAWMIAWQEQTERQPLAQRKKVLLLAAPPPRLLLGDGLQHSSKPEKPVFSSPTVVFDAGAMEWSEDSAFVQRLARLRPRIERLIANRWYDEFDAYELDNLIQAGLVHLWQAYSRAPHTFDERGDGYWYQTVKQGAKYEVIREFRQRYRQEGSGSHKNRHSVEVVMNAGDVLARQNLSNTDDLDETLLSGNIIYSHDTQEIQQADQRLDWSQLKVMLYTGTHPSDHPLITKIVHYMREGITQQEMARREGVNVATIRCTIRRMQQACGVSREAKKNRERPGERLDGRIRALRRRGLGGPEIARLIGTDFTFVYRRLRKMNLK